MRNFDTAVDGMHMIIVCQSCQQLLEEYLDKYMNPSEVKFSDPIWKVLLSDAVKR